MKKQFVTIMMAVVIGVFLSAGNGFCGDLDDEIEVDDNITAYDDLGKTEKNINFIKLKAKMEAKMAQKQAEKNGTGGSSESLQGGAMNSVVMGAGSNVRGDIIIIDESKGDKTQVVE
ncbi:MAG: hypothetical protein ACOZF0_23880 [Thermodesulfobacteriota bacterium]